MKRPAQTKIRFAVGKNCNTVHAVPAELTDRRLKALMDAVYLHGSKDTVSLGWLAANNYIDITGGYAFVTLHALPLVRILKRAGWYYWAGSTEPALVTENGRHVDQSYACSYIAELRATEPVFPHSWRHPIDVVIRALQTENCA